MPGGSLDRPGPLEELPPESVARLSAPLVDLGDRGAGVLGAAARTAGGTAALLNALAERVRAPAFAERFRARVAAVDRTPAPPGEAVALAERLLEEMERGGDEEEQGDAEEDEDASFVLVDHEDVHDAVAAFLADLVAEHPRASELPPHELQKAVARSLDEFAAQRSPLRRLCNYGRYAYCAGTLVTSTAFSLYEHPWLVRILLGGLWSSVRMTVGLVGLVAG